MNTIMPQPGPGVEAPLPADAPVFPYSDDELLDLWRDEIRKECFEHRYVFERQWMRNIYYILGRQWIEYYGRGGGWRDKRLAQWIPKPVTNKCKETLTTIRAMFTAIKLGVNIRPNGSDPENVSAAATADDLAPLLYETHDMNRVFSEFDFWLIATGNAFMHSFVDFDVKYGQTVIDYEQCLGCGQTYGSDELAGKTACPSCGSPEFGPATDPETGAPMQKTLLKGQPTTIALSPLELAFPNSYGRFNDLPYVVRLRWRTKHYYENHPGLQQYVDLIKWQKAPADQSLQLFRSLANHNDLGLSTAYLDKQTTSEEEGVPEYEVWYKPCGKYPQGLVFRVAGDQDPIIIHLDDEGLPGAIPYADADGQKLFTFTHAAYEQVGGRILGSGPIDLIIQKQDQLNQLDSMILLIINRMANPVWLEPKGAEVERLTGMPGLVVKWNPLTVGGNAKPERIPGEGPHTSLFTIREQYLRDIEELAGTFDIMKGAKPTGVEAFSAMQLLVERSQARFSPVFQARGDAFKDMMRFALELERAYGPDERTKAILSPARDWTFQNFKKAQLQGSFSVVVEDGTAAPKTNLGLRAAVEHAKALGIIDMADPDQKYEGLKLFGLVKMIPTLDVDVQSALQKQQAFEKWARDEQALAGFVEASAQQDVENQAKQQAAAVQGMTTGMPVEPELDSPLKLTPLKWRKWYNPVIHRQEFLKWANSDVIRQLLEEKPAMEGLLEAHLTEIEVALMEQQMLLNPQPAGQAPGGGAMGMGNSNRESTSGNEPGGLGEGAQNAGPR